MKKDESFNNVAAQPLFGVLLAHFLRFQTHKERSRLI